MHKAISILGSTGSIGTQTLEVIRNLKNIEIKGLTTNTNIDLFEKQIREFKPEKAAVMNIEKAKELKDRIKDCNVEVLSGLDGIIEIASLNNIDMVINSVVGNIGLEPTIKAIQCKKDIGLANKETLVTAGELVMREAKLNNIKIYPIDSEHSAIFQCLQGNEENNINKIYLTASGGPFRTYNDLSDISLEDALKHPNWEMGKKITIDSATLMNKGLEVIEAKWLFNVDVDKIQVLVHPQSIIHSMVEFEDGAVIAQLGEPDMKVPIQYALTYPKRVKNNYPKVNFLERCSLTFEEPNYKLFPCLNLAFDAIKIGGTLPAVLNGANEAAVDKFLNKEISFSDIPILIENAMKAYNIKYNYSLKDIIEADNWARAFINQF